MVLSVTPDKCQNITSMGWRTLSSKSLPIHHPWIAVSFGALQSSYWQCCQLNHRRKIPGLWIEIRSWIFRLQIRSTICSKMVLIAVVGKEIWCSKKEKYVEGSSEIKNKKGNNFSGKSSFRFYLYISVCFSIDWGIWTYHISWWYWFIGYAGCPDEKQTK